MNNQKPLQHSPPIRFEELNWVASSALPRDREQSNRLHEPDHLIGTIDPMTGRDTIDVISHPSLVDADVCIHCTFRDIGIIPGSTLVESQR